MEDNLWVDRWVIYNKKAISSLNNSFNSVIQIFHRVYKVRLGIKLDQLLMRKDYIHRLWWSGIECWKK